MRPVTLFSTIMALTPASLALRIPYQPTGPPPDLPPSLLIPVYNFYAFIADPGVFQQQSEVDFVISDRSYATSCSVGVEANETIFSEYKYHPCAVQDEYPDIKYSFLIREGFSEITIKKSWNSNG